MRKALIPPVSQQIFPSTCTIDNESIVPLPERDGAFDPEPHPSNIEQVTCNADSTVGEDENVQFAIREDISYR